MTWHDDIRRECIPVCIFVASFSIWLIDDYIVQRLAIPFIHCFFVLWLNDHSFLYLSLGCALVMSMLLWPPIVRLAIKSLLLCFCCVEPVGASKRQQ